MKKLSSKKLHLREAINNTWSLVAPRKSSAEDLVNNQKIWEDLSDLRVFDIIYVNAADESWFAEYLVIDNGEGPGVFLLRAVNLPRKRHVFKSL